MAFKKVIEDTQVAGNIKVGGGRRMENWKNGELENWWGIFQFSNFQIIC